MSEEATKTNEEQPRFQPTSEDGEKPTAAPAANIKSGLERAIEAAANKPEQQPTGEERASNEPPRKPTQAESAGALRKMMEAEKARADQLEERFNEFKQVFGEAKAEELAPVWQKLNEVAGDDGADKFFDRFNTLKEEYDATVARVQKQEEALKELDIQRSDEFRREAVEPFNKAKEIYLSLFTGEPDAESVSRQILEANTLAEVKEIVDQYDILAPNYIQIVKARDELLEKHANQNKMVENWQQIQKERQEQRELAAARKAKELREAEALARREDFKAAKKKFKLADMAGFVDEGEFNEVAGAVYDSVESLIAGESNEGLDASYERSIKGQLWDSINDGKGVPGLLRELADAKAELARIRGTAPGVGGGGSASSSGDVGGGSAFDRALAKAGYKADSWSGS